MDSYFKSEESFEATRKLLETVNYTTDDFLFVWDIAKDINWFFGKVDASYAIREPGGVTNTTEDMMRIIYPPDRAAVKKDLSNIAAGIQDTHNMNYRWVNRQGNKVWVNCHGQVIRDKNGEPSIMIGRVSEESLRHLYNPLTGLWNKTKLRADLKRLLAKSQGYLMFLDIDGLSAINLRYGRSYGDQLLMEIATMLENSKLIAKAYHINNNHFAVYVKTKMQSEVQELFEQLQHEINEKFSFTGSAVPIDKQIFIDAGQLVDAANLTLKKAKEGARGHLKFFSSHALKERITAFALLEELKQSVENNFEGFEVYYQPQVRAQSYNLYGVEALLRYQSPTRGRVFPDEFIPLLEQSRLIHDVGMWVLQQALVQCKEWRQFVPNLHISVNFSAIQFEDPYLNEKIIEKLQTVGVSGEILTVELTESVELHKNEAFRNQMKILIDYGVRFSIDDFGTGYSNLGYLKSMNVNEVKIDRVFVSGIEKETYNHKLIRNIIEFAKENAIVVCCEGVESTREMAVLETLKPDIIQGYLFDKPMDAKSIEKAYIDCESDEYQARVQFVDKIHQIREQMGLIHFDAKAILKNNEVGLWIIRIHQTEERYELHVDETMRQILASNQKYTPQECYEYWFSRVSTDYIEYVQRNVQLMMEGNTMVQLEYPWLHPTQGMVMVRCSGKRVADMDGMIVLEGYHRIINNVESI